MDKEPWDFNPDLRRDRIIAVAARLLSARNEVLDRREIENGDDAYATGTRAFSWQCEAIRKMSAESQHDWLTLAKSTQEFIFRIGSVPARFYRGEHDRPTSRTLRQTFPELMQARLNFGDDTQTTVEVIWRYAIETFQDGEVQRIMFCGFDAALGIPVCVWEVPLDEDDNIASHDVDDPNQGPIQDWTVTGEDLPDSNVADHEEDGTGKESE